MPFFDEDERPLHVIELRQTPADGHYFQLVQKIGFREHDRAESESNPTYWAPAHIPRWHPAADNRTDLASVPWFLWSFIASYGRQTAPALVHDHFSEEARKLGGADALKRRKEIDRIFRVGLRQQKAPLLRAWLMWAFVSIGRYFENARWLFLLLAAQALLGLGLVYLAIVLAIISGPGWLVLLPVPAVLAVLWWREAALMIWLTYASAFFAPLVLVQAIVVLLFEACELLVREAIDRPFVDHRPSTTVGPFSRPPDETGTDEPGTGEPSTREPGPDGPAAGTS